MPERATSSKFRLSLGLKILLYSLLFLLLAWWGGRVAYDRAMQQLHVEGSDRLLNSIGQLRRSLGQYNYLPFLVAQNLQVRDFLRQPDEHNRTLVNRVLEQFNLVAGSTALFVLDPTGEALAYSNWRDESSQQLRSQWQQHYFQQALAGEQGQELQYQEDLETATFFMSAPIYDGGLVGVAVIRLDVPRLSEQLTTDHPLLVVSPTGELVFKSDLGWPLGQLESRLLSDGTRLQLVPHKDSMAIIHRVELDDLGWQVSTLTDIRPARQREQLVVASVLSGGVALGLLLLYLRESRQKRRLQLERLQERARSEEQQRDIINTAQVGLIHITPSGQVELVNPMAMQLFGVSAEQIRHQPVLNLLRAGFSARPLQQALGALGSERFQPLTGLEVVGQRADGSEFPMLISIRQMDRHPELGYLVTLIDISRRKRLEQALREANESLEQKVVARTQALQEAQAELVQAGKLAALGRMSASVVHELNQPMTAMRTYLAIAEKQLDNPDALVRNLRQQQQLLDRMALITGQLKTFAYRKPERIDPVSLQQVMEQVLQLFRGRFEELDLQLHFDPPPPDMKIAGDAARYEQVMINLIKNSCDAMSTQPGEHHLWISVQAIENGQMLLDVRDNGPGIEPEHRTQLFEPFFTTKEVGQGLGLGLAIVQSILRDLGGSIEPVDQAEGACFRLSMPLYQPRSK
jgi:PAS domain S-box-containing protein